MKTLNAILAAVCFCAMLGSCNSDNDGNDDHIPLQPGKYYAGKGQIIRAEYMACVCCGGWWLKTEQADSVLFGNVPENSSFTFEPDDSFPIPVEYGFFVDSSVCWQIRRLVTMQTLKKL